MLKGRVSQVRRVAQEGRAGQVGLAGRIGFACVLLVSVVSGFSRTVIGREQSQPPKPSFQATVEVTPLDVTVVDDHGKPVPNLTPADFNVRIDGGQRRVVSAEWIPLAAESSAPAAPPPDGYSTNDTATGGRLIVIGVDQPNIRFGGAVAIAKAANSFIDRLAPSDRVAVAGFGIGAPATTFTADRERVKRAISRMVGQHQVQRSVDVGHNIALVEAQMIDRGDRSTLDTIQQRECATAGMTPGALEMCRSHRVRCAKSLSELCDRATLAHVHLDLPINVVGETAVQQDPQPNLLRCIGLAVRQLEVNSLGHDVPQV